MNTAVASYSIYVRCHHVLPSRLLPEGGESRIGVLDLALLLGPDTPLKKAVQGQLLAWQKKLGRNFSTVSFQLPKNVSLRNLKMAQLVFE